MYKNAFWFTLGYITCKHVVPIAIQTIIKFNEKTKEPA